DGRRLDRREVTRAGRDAARCDHRDLARDRGDRYGGGNLRGAVDGVALRHRAAEGDRNHVDEVGARDHDGVARRFRRRCETRNRGLGRDREAIVADAGPGGGGAGDLTGGGGGGDGHDEFAGGGRHDRGGDAVEGDQGVGPTDGQIRAEDRHRGAGGPAG